MFVTKTVEVGVVARPARTRCRLPSPAQVPQDIAIGVENADLGNGGSLKLLLPAGFTQQVLRREHRRRSVVLARQDRRHKDYIGVSGGVRGHAATNAV